MSISTPPEKLVGSREREHGYSLAPPGFQVLRGSIHRSSSGYDIVHQHNTLRDPQPRGNPKGNLPSESTVPREPSLVFSTPKSIEVSKFGQSHHFSHDVRQVVGLIEASFIPAIHSNRHRNDGRFFHVRHF